MTEKYYFFPEDILALEEKIRELHARIEELGREQGEVAQQSTENFGHDDFPQEAIFQQRRLVLSRLNDLGNILKNAVVINFKKDTDVIRFGSVVGLSDGKIIRIGSYLVFAEYKITNISYASPLGKALIGKKIGDKITLGGKAIKILSVN